MREMGVVNSLSAMAYSSEDVQTLVKGTHPQVITQAGLAIEGVSIRVG